MAAVLETFVREYNKSTREWENVRWQWQLATEPDKHQKVSARTTLRQTKKTPAKTP